SPEAVNPLSWWSPRLLLRLQAAARRTCRAQGNGLGPSIPEGQVRRSNRSGCASQADARSHSSKPVRQLGMVLRLGRRGTPPRIVHAILLAQWQGSPSGSRLLKAERTPAAGRIVDRISLLL